MPMPNLDDVYLALKVVFKTFILIVIGEIGDRSQFMLFMLTSTTENVYGLVLGAIAAHIVTTTIAVMGARYIAEKISQRTIMITGGCMYILFGVVTFFMILFDTDTEDNPHVAVYNYEQT